MKCIFVYLTEWTEFKKKKSPFTQVPGALNSWLRYVLSEGALKAQSAHLSSTSWWENTKRCEWWLPVSDVRSFLHQLFLGKIISCTHKPHAKVSSGTLENSRSTVAGSEPAFFFFFLNTSNYLKKAVFFLSVIMATSNLKCTPGLLVYFDQISSQKLAWNVTYWAFKLTGVILIKGSSQ